uniref:Uncharacterized protein n=1 Tax=Timspurckia oligopyrenoides TaxID=708627 RepID=A0A7S0ZGY1_9RHOD|mmetsp:Transcript_4840/g.8441  ORF Transcript_4840/g.8441 Transcript_4840/m.8441 type:complete len:174 (+) Transcript_4840:468-989(+)|eukprot:CAMPEP_0182446594 /NCGR_PEP_ID=MMETSP1172-20130603/4299_1 /TAXON_ID=708627 /ORGANISM="Timspurckia oligopyrenoides, Strain CCMP3278" /LENGTH=173 /DNA_ID=CAMNT_0024642545 /DNA_START=375 /DNA_END=896 /DNA_ORIENTATION=-
MALSNLDRISIANLVSQNDGTDSVPELVVESRLCSSRVEMAPADQRLDSVMRRFWQPDEDELLISLVKKYGARKWTRLSMQFKNRTGGQLRARWMHTLCGMDTRKPFTPEEDAYIVQSQATFGNRWAEIARSMQGRSDNSVKNRFRVLENQKKRIQSFAKRVFSFSSEEVNSS